MGYIIGGRLTYPCLEVSFTSVVISEDAFVNIFLIEHVSRKHLKESCCWLCTISI